MAIFLDTCKTKSNRYSQPLCDGSVYQDLAVGTTFSDPVFHSGAKQVPGMFCPIRSSLVDRWSQPSRDSIVYEASAVDTTFVDPVFVSQSQRRQASTWYVLSDPI